MIRIHFVMKAEVVVPDDALYAVCPRACGAQIEAQNLLHLLFRIRFQQLVGDGADHLMALIAPSRRGGRIEQADQTTQYEDHSQHESSRSIMIKNIGVHWLQSMNNTISAQQCFTPARFAS